MGPGRGPEWLPEALHLCIERGGVKSTRRGKGVKDYPFRRIVTKVAFSPGSRSTVS